MAHYGAIVEGQDIQFILGDHSQGGGKWLQMFVRFRIRGVNEPSQSFTVPGEDLLLYESANSRFHN